MEDSDRYTKLLNIDQPKPPIPELPKTIEELAGLLGKTFKSLKTSDSIPISGEGYGTGGVSASRVALLCPFCEMEFNAIHTYGCFHSAISPDNCPNCSFPWNVINTLMALLEEEREKE